MKMIIGGKKVDSSSGKSIPVINPATHQQIDTVPNATKEDLYRAIKYAREGLKEWSAYNVEKRAEILRRAAELQKKEADEIAKLITEELGKPYSEALGEVMGSASVFCGYADKIRHEYGSVLPRLNGDHIEIKREPLGIVACIIPFNFPVDLFCHKAAPALAAGNVIIVKPSTETPLADIYMTDLLHRAGVPIGAAQILTGKGEEIGNWLVESEEIDAVNMTGSTDVGVEIARKASSNLKKVFLELGGNDPFIIFDDADIDKAVEETVNNRLLNCGQTCCAPKRFIVHRTVYKEYTEKLIAKLKDITIGDPFDPSNRLGPLVSHSAAEKVGNQVSLTISEGAKLICGGNIVNKTFFEPTILTDVSKHMSIAKDMEVFGPVIPIIAFDSDEEAISIANQTKYGLSAGLMCNDLKRAVKISEKINSGCVSINGTGLCRTADMPFGGHKMSGTGGEGFYNTLEEMQRIKITLIKDVYAD